MRKVMIGIVLAVVVTLLCAGSAFAADPTTVEVEWDGSGAVWTDVAAGDDATSGFFTGGETISGSYATTDSNNNPYSYGVDSFSSHLNASVENGVIDTWCTRTDSKTSMYGDAGQSSWSFVGVDDGVASMAYRSTTNYAAMKDCGYKFQLPGGHNVVVDGASYYEIDRGVEDGRGNSGTLSAYGDGDATLDCMSTEASGCWDLRFGRGCGCYVDANFNAAGSSGHFEVFGEGNNSVTFNGMGMSSGGGSLGIVADWVGSFSIADYSLTAN